MSASPISSMLYLAFSTLVVSCASTYMGGASYQLDKDIYYKDKKTERLRGEVYVPAGQGKFPGVILVHGGGWRSRDLTDMNHIAKSLASNGFVTFNINYRLSPEHKHPTPIDDLSAAYDYFVKNAAQYKLDPQKIALWGYSSGGHTVSYFALKNPKKVKAVVTGGAPYDFTWYTHSPYIKGYLGKYRDEALAEYFAASPVNLIRQGAPDFFVYHALSDKLVEYAQATAFEAELMRHNVSVERYDVSFWGHALAFLVSGESIEKGVEFIKTRLSSH